MMLYWVSVRVFLMQPAIVFLIHAEYQGAYYTKFYHDTFSHYYHINIIIMTNVASTGMT
jgi:hypothetical protein